MSVDLSLPIRWRGRSDPQLAAPVPFAGLFACRAVGSGAPCLRALWLAPRFCFLSCSSRHENDGILARAPHKPWCRIGAALAIEATTDKTKARRKFIAQRKPRQG